MWRAVLRAVVLVCALLLQCPVADTSVLTASTADSDNAPQECVDRKHSDGRTWKNVFGKACEWYALGATRCDDYGKGFITEFTALEACCVCGGGVQGAAPTDDAIPEAPQVETSSPRTPPPTTPAPQCVDRTLASGSLWIDRRGRSCVWWASSTPGECDLFAFELRNEFTAKEACCACGGGMSADLLPDPSQCADLPLSNGDPWRDSTGDPCAWYTPTRCISDGAFYAVPGDPTAQQACCVCGGGASGDLPPALPQCSDFPLSNGDPWANSVGYGCGWYSPSRCSTLGASSPSEGGPTANEVCCACGGGSWTGTPTEVRLWGRMRLPGLSLPGMCADFTQSMRDRFVAVVQTLLKAHARVDIACGTYVHYVVHALVPWDPSRSRWWAPQLQEVLLKDPVLSRLQAWVPDTQSTPCEATGALSAVERDGMCHAMLCEPHLTLASPHSGKLICDTQPSGTGWTSSSGFSEADVAGIIVGCIIGMIILAAVAFCLLRPGTARSHPRSIHAYRVHAGSEPVVE